MRDVKSRPSNPQAAVRGEALFYYSLVTAFVVLGVIGVLHHAMWRDEVYAWLMARFSNSLRDLYLVARYDNHFMLWHVVLWILSRFTHNCQSMQWLHLALATGSVWVLVRFSPFTRVQKALYCFGYFAMFEYCLIAREYVWIVLLLFSLCAVRDRRKDSFVAQAVILFLLSNINALATIIAFSFVAASALEHIRRRDVGELWATRKRALILSGVILCVALISDGLQSIKPKDATLFQRWPRPMTDSTFVVALGDVWRGYVPIPRPFPHLLTRIGGSPHFRKLIWGSNFLLDSAPLASNIGIGCDLISRLAGDVGLDASAEPDGPHVVLVRDRTDAVVSFRGLRGRRCGMTVFILYCIWRAYGAGSQRGRDQKPRSSSASLLVPMERFFLPSILAIQVVAGAYAWTLHLMTPFSASKQAADFIRQHGYANLLIIGSKEPNVTPVTCLSRSTHLLPRQREVWDILVGEERPT